MAKKKKNKTKLPRPETLIAREVPAKEIPTFEIGKKGDEFDRMYTRAVREKTADADRLLKDLSRESKADKFNFLDAILPLLLIVFAALTFGVVSRGDIEELFTVSFSKETLLDGSYTAQLDRIYNDTLPFGEEIAYIGSFFGFGEQQKPTPDEEELPEIPPEEEDPVVSEPIVTEPAVTTPPETAATTEPTTEPEPAVTEPLTYMMETNAKVNVRTEPSADAERLDRFEKGELVEVLEILENGWAKILYGDGYAYVFAEYLSAVDGAEPPTVTETTAAESEVVPDGTEETGDDVEYEITVMYATSTVNIRLEPSTDSAILGYFIINEAVDVVEMRSDGWAKILYNGMTAYVYSEYLDTEPVVTTVEEEDEPEVTEASDETTSEETEVSEDAEQMQTDDTEETSNGESEIGEEPNE